MKRIERLPGSVCRALRKVFAGGAQLLLLALLVMVVDTARAITQDANGVYQIGTANELYEFAQIVNGNHTSIAQNKGANAVLTANIVVNKNVLDKDGNLNGDGSSFRSWTPIGSESKPYTGTFNGKGHTISGLYYSNSETEYVGLFGLSSGTIDSVGVLASYFKGGYYVGGVCAFNSSGTIINSYNTGSVSGNKYGGGVCAFNSSGTISNSYNTGSVSGSVVGGVCAFHLFSGTLNNCYNTGSVSGSVVGGVCGITYDFINNCYCTSETLVGSGYTTNCSTKTPAQFASGEVAYLLQQYVNENNSDGKLANWGQKLGTDINPVFSANTVYAEGTCDGVIKKYSNAKLKITHIGDNYVNGFCPRCGAYQPATLNNGTYEIANAGQLYWFATLVNDSTNRNNASAILTANIVVNKNVLDKDGNLNGDGSSFRSWTPIGSQSNHYTGTFNGQDHTISGLYFNNTGTEYVGLFGYVSGSKSKVESVGVLDSYFSGKSNVGGVCGSFYSCSVSNCYSAATVNGASSVGGICGNLSYTSIDKCYNTGFVKSKASAGGVCGVNSGTIGNRNTFSNCYNTGNVTGGENTGGVCGIIGCNMTDCFNTGDVVGTLYTGGVIGKAFCGYVSNVYNTGSVTGTSSVGGVCGYNEDYIDNNISNKSIITNSYNTGSVKASIQVGGVCGRNTGTLSRCSNSGNVTSESSSTGSIGAGGICGYIFKATGSTANDTTLSSIVNCYNTGAVYANGAYSGGVCGASEGGTLKNCYSSMREYSNVGAGVSCKNYARIIKCYYLAVGDLTDANSKKKTEEQFASGEVAYLLQNGQTEQVWGQKIGTDTIPLFSTDAVYRYLNCKSVYSYCNDKTMSGKTGVHNYADTFTVDVEPTCTVNGSQSKHCLNAGCSSKTSVTSIEVIAHDYENGFCTRCGGYEHATLNNGIYEIANAGQLYWFASLVNDSSKASAKAVLTANIVVNENVLDKDGNINVTDSASFRKWTPIGNYSNSYYGTFNGKGHTVSGLYFNNSETDYVGLIGCYNWGTIESVGVIASYLIGKNYVGGVCGSMGSYATIINSYNTGRVSGGSDVGGVCGYNTGGDIINSYNTGRVSGGSDVGGVCGYNSSAGTVSNSYNTGRVSGSSDVGGVCGYNYGTVSNCYCTSETLVRRGSATNCATKTLAQFASGEVAYLLQQYVNENNSEGKLANWGQKLPIDTIPVFSSNTVYTYLYCSGKADYSNDESKEFVQEHEFSTEYTVDVEPTCTTAGSKSKHCQHSGCTASVDTVEITALGHDYLTEYTVDVEPSCITVGSKSKHCQHSRCTASIDTVEIAVIDHDYSTEYTVDVEPTCTTAGSKSKHCQYRGCTASIDTVEIAALGHSWGEWDTTKVATCEEAGSRSHICKVDNYNETEKTEALGHDYNVNGFCSRCDGYQPATDADNDGTYEIANAGQLYWFANLVNSGTTAAKAELTADIVVNENVLDKDGNINVTDSASFRKWTPIGNTSKNYTGTFNGKGHTISGLYFNNSETNYVGLFGCSNGTIDSVGVIASYFIGYSNVGGVCVINCGTVSNCYNTGSVNGSSYVGGVCGYNSSAGTVSNCYNTGSVNGSGNFVGGVCGENNGTVSNCYNTGSVSGSSDYVGGVCGSDFLGININCYNTGSVNGSGNFVGGVCGLDFQGIKSNCYNTGSVSGNMGVGGVCGINVSNVINCYNTGSVSGSASVGGVYGCNNYGTVSNCYNTGSVSGSSYVGGVGACNNYGTVSNCYNTGLVNGTDSVGGLCGLNTGYVEYCYSSTPKLIGANDEDADVYFCAEKTADQFASGEVAILLQKYVDENKNNSKVALANWTQTIGDTIPTFGKGGIEYIREKKSNNWGTLCVPYAISKSNATFYTIDQKDGDVLVLKALEKVEDEILVEPGLPVIYYCADDTLNVHVQDFGTPVDPENENSLLKGVYEQDTIRNGSTYYLKGDKFYARNGYFVINPFKAYIELPAAPGAPRALNFALNNETTTGVDEVENDGVAEEAHIVAIYNVKGQRVSNMEKDGIYMVKMSDGSTKKVVVR